MSTLTFDRIQSYRKQTFRWLPGRRIHHRDEAVAFVQQIGYIFFWPIKGIIMPSLWGAVAGDRPVADAHDDPGHITWGWKDALLGQRAWYYAKILRKRSTMVSMDVIPYFYALSENYGSYEEDYLTLYEQGRMTQEAKSIYEALLHEGALDTVALRKATRMTSRDSDGRFNKAISDLQADLKIVPVAVTEAGAWHYAFAYDITARHYPEIPEQAYAIKESEARQKLAAIYLRAVGAIQANDLMKLFGWSARQAQRIVTVLEQDGFVKNGLLIDGQPGEWISLTGLIDHQEAVETNLEF